MFDVRNRTGAEVNFELKSMEGMLPGEHLRIDERARTIFADSRNVRVIVNQPSRIDIIEGTLDEIGGLCADPADFFRLMIEGPTNVMK